MKDDDLTPYEKKAMETLPKEHMPTASLEDKVVGALHSEGLLGQPRRRVIELTGVRVAAALAACVALLVGGYALGTMSGPRQVGGPPGTAITDASVPVAASLQRAGTAYVSFLEDLADMPALAQGDDARQGKEVALKSLYMAADQIGRIIHNDALSECIVSAIVDTKGPSTGERDMTGTQVIRF